MAYDEDLEDRVRAIITTTYEITEQRMFGGLAFLIGGNMAIAVSREGLLVRVSRADAERLVATANAQQMVMRGRRMGGRLRVSGSDVPTKRQLGRWVKLGATYAASLPPKGGTQS